MAVNTAATAQMARFYGIPSRGGGAITDSKLPDAQAGMESMMSQLMATLSGVHFVLHSAGILEGYMAASYEKFIIDDEICGMCKRIKRGETIDPVNLALEVIAQVGPGGEYLTHEHTFRNFRRAFYTPIMEQREGYTGWKEKGAEPIEKAANRKWKQILASYQEPLMPDEALGELERYIAKKYAK
jgi:trimethylamine--corrinoid protein Co-methyltransferase